MLIRVIEFISAFLSIVGAKLVREKRVRGFVFWVITNVMWIAYTFITAQYFMMLMYCVFLYYAVSSIHYWINGKTIDEKTNIVQKERKM